MPIVQIDTEMLKNIVKESVTEATKADRYKFFEAMMPAISDEEMKDIIAHFGAKPPDFDCRNISDWFIN